MVEPTEANVQYLNVNGHGIETCKCKYNIMFIHELTCYPNRLFYLERLDFAAPAWFNENITLKK